jgi:hypothetical protein
MAEIQEFATFLLQHAKGRTHDQLSAALSKVVKAVIDTGKDGQITLSVKVKPMPKVDGMVKIEDGLTVKVPELDRPASMWFATDEGQLSADHPNQPSMFDTNEKAA